MSGIIRCRLCGEAIGSSYFSKTWNDPHYKTYHPEYSEFVPHWVKNFVIVGSFDAVILGGFLYLLYHYWTPNPLLVVAALTLYLVPLWILMVFYYRRVTDFKREWREQHPNRGQRP